LSELADGIIYRRQEMKNRDYENEEDWAREVPQRRFHGPYGDYGWERGQSVLPEFRDPDFHFSPEERERLQSEQDVPGPFRGRGPRGYVRSDERIHEDVCERMTRHGQLDASNIEVEVKNGEVYLTGDVASRRAKRLAEDISDAVSGVKDVHNNLQINTPERWVDRVGRSGVYPSSEAEAAPRDSESQGMASWGQGDRGARGYEDHGDSEIHPEH
jgi:hypothetical protein